MLKVSRLKGTPTYAVAELARIERLDTLEGYGVSRRQRPILEHPGDSSVIDKTSPRPPPGFHR